MLKGHGGRGSASERLLGSAIAAGEKAKVPGGIFLWGVLLPCLALLIETQTHFCARHYFDPLPSNAHVFLFGLIPATNLLIWTARFANLVSMYASITLLHGMAMGIAFMYALMFMPIVPISLPLILAFGIGFLGLCPLLSIFALRRSGLLLTNLVAGAGTFFEPHAVKHLGHLVVLTTVLVVEFPSTMTRVCLSMAAEPKTEQQGLKLLRQYGNEEVMLRACYERSGRATDVLGTFAELAHPVPPAKARYLFYRVTGKPFNSVPIPPSARATIARAGGVSDLSGQAVGDEFDLDVDMAGETVSGVSRGLSLEDSTLSGRIEDRARLLTVDWTMRFANSSIYDREVRARVMLPPGAVVNGAAVLVDGRWKSAVILPKKAARAVYRKSVAGRKDPLLISYSGPDRVLVQCFPVPAKGVASVRLSVVIPVRVGGDGSRASVQLPSFEERNFKADADHSFEFRSLANLHINNVAVTDRSQDGLHVISGRLPQSLLSRGEAVLSLDNSYSSAVFAPDAFGSAVWSFVGQELDRTAPPKITSVTCIIDGSQSMAAHIGKVRDGLLRMPPSMHVKLILVADGARVLTPDGTTARGEEFKKACLALTENACCGGQPNMNVVRQECRAAASINNSCVLWIHGPQPLAEDAAGSEDSAPRSRRTILYDLQLSPGPVHGVEELDRAFGLSRLDRAGDVGEDLNRQFAIWDGRVVPTTLKYRYVAGKGGNKSQDSSMASAIASSVVPSPALAQLWAADYVDQWLATRLPEKIAECADLSARYQIVTPVSSAIVAEVEQPRWSASTGSTTKGDGQMLKLGGVKANSGRIALNALNSFRSSQRFDGLVSMDAAAPIATDMRKPAEDSRTYHDEGTAAGSFPEGVTGTQSAGSSEAPDSPALELEAEPDAGKDSALAKPVPEADTWLLLAACGCVLAFLAGRRRLMKRSC